MTCEISDKECINCEEPYCLGEAVETQKEHKNMQLEYKNMQQDLRELHEKITKKKTTMMNYYKDNEDKINDHRTWMY